MSQTLNKNTEWTSTYVFAKNVSPVLTNPKTGKEFRIVELKTSKMPKNEIIKLAVSTNLLKPKTTSQEAGKKFADPSAEQLAVEKFGYFWLSQPKTAENVIAIKKTSILLDELDADGKKQYENKDEKISLSPSEFQNLLFETNKATLDYINKPKTIGTVIEEAPEREEEAGLEF